MTEENYRKRHRHYHSFMMRGIYCFVLIFSVLAAGTVGIHSLEKFPYIDAFYFACMIATSQGPAPDMVPHTAAGKLFISLLAFISTGSMVASAGFLFGPFFGRLWKLGVDKLEEEVKHLKNKS